MSKQMVFMSILAVASAFALPPPAISTLRCGSGQTLYQVKRDDGDTQWQEFRCVRMDVPNQSGEYRNAIYGEGYHLKSKAFYRYLGYFWSDSASGGVRYGTMTTGDISGNGETRKEALTSTFKLEPSGVFHVPERQESWIPQESLTLSRVNVELKNCGPYFHRWQVREQKGNATKMQGLRCSTDATVPGWVWYGKGWRGSAAGAYEQMGVSEIDSWLDNPTGSLAYTSDFCGPNNCPDKEEKILLYFDYRDLIITPAFTWPEMWIYKKL